ISGTSIYVLDPKNLQAYQSVLPPAEGDGNGTAFDLFTVLDSLGRADISHGRPHIYLNKDAPQMFTVLIRTQLFLESLKQYGIDASRITADNLNVAFMTYLYVYVSGGNQPRIIPRDPRAAFINMLQILTK